MSDRHLHIVCFDVPWPVDYGGVFDPFYKIKSLSEAGIKVHLHCFEYGRGRPAELEKWCYSVDYYPRKTIWKSIATRLPHSVVSRSSDKLLHNLLQDDYPVLMEGIHCTYYLHTGDLPRNRCFVRLHNVEHKYYRQIAEAETSATKQAYYKRESKLLYEYEKSLRDKATFWTMTKADLEDFHQSLGYASIDYLPVYLPETEPFFSPQKGTYCLYHGNLGVAENEFAAIWLLDNIFDSLQIPFVIAGKNPSPTLEYHAHKRMHTCLVANPDEPEMDELVKKAQVHILPSFNCTGVKLKLLEALRKGKFCVVNDSGVKGTDVENCCVIANTTADMKRAVSSCFQSEFTEDQFLQRVQVMSQIFSNQRNAGQMIQWIWQGVPTQPGKSIAWPR